MKLIKTYESFINEELNLNKDVLLNTIKNMIGILYDDAMENDIGIGLGGVNLTSYFPENLINELKDIEVEPVGHEYHGYIIDETDIISSDGYSISISLSLYESRPASETGNFNFEDDIALDIEEFDEEFLLEFMKILSKIPKINIRQNSEIFKKMNED